MKSHRRLTASLALLMSVVAVLMLALMTWLIVLLIPVTSGVSR